MALSPLFFALSLLAAPPTLWRFPDENADALREAVAAAGLPDHLVTPAAIDGHLKAAKAPADLGCLADRGTCPDPDRAMLGLLGLAGRMEATATVEAANVHVLFLFTPAEPGAPERTVRGDAATLPAAVSAALADLQGQATLTVDADPPDVSLTLDGQPLGKPPGPFYIPPGEHVVGASRPDRIPGETSIRVGAGDKAAVRFRLPAAVTRLRLEYIPADARVKVDQEPFADHPGLFDIAPGRHVIRVESAGYKAEERVLEVAPGTTAEARFELVAKFGSFMQRLESRHPDVGGHPVYAHAGLRTAILTSGAVKTGKNRRRVDELTESSELAGLDLGVGWRGQWLVADFSLGYLGGGDVTKADVGGGAKGYVDDLRRIVLRPAVGGHLVFWRFEPYLMVGPVVSFESYKADTLAIVPGDTGTSWKTDRQLLSAGTELGLRFQVNDVWAAGLGGAAEFGASQPAAFAFLVQAGYCIGL